MKTSNKFTFARILISPVFFVIYSLPFWLKLPAKSPLSIISCCICIPLLIFAELTDYFDGYFARKHNQVSDFGKMFDPFADVFLHLSTFTAFVFTGHLHPALYALILYREFSQSFLRMIAAKNGTAIAARKGGKMKTVCYVGCCFICLIIESLNRFGLTQTWALNPQIFKYITNGVFGLCVLMAYISFIDYLKNFGSVLKESAK